LAALVPAPSAGAAPISAAVTGDLGGTRTVAVLTATVNMARVAATTNVDGLFDAQVVETQIAGATWEVKAAVSQLVKSGAATPTAAQKILATNMSLIPVNATSTLPAGTNAAGAGGAYGTADLGVTGTAQRIWANSGEDVNAFYTSTHSSLGNKLRFSVPNGTETGTYTGTLTVTLV
jgi:hypothetical protein